MSEVGLRAFGGIRRSGEHLHSLAASPSGWAGDVLSLAGALSRAAGHEGGSAGRGWKQEERRVFLVPGRVGSGRDVGAGEEREERSVWCQTLPSLG